MVNYTAEKTADNKPVKGILKTIHGDDRVRIGVELMLTSDMKNIPEFIAKVQEGEELCGA